MSIRRQEALDYHSQGRPGKIQVSPTKPFKNQRDLSLAYTPGVAEPCLEIRRHPEDVYTYTARGNLVAVVSNGTAGLGLGNIGALAAKPVMEGKAILFKKFADIDVFDLEVGSEDPEDLIRFCQLLEPTVGGINLEDVRSPDCFYVEEQLRERLSIPVFHDDQHGTAIITGAALLNALELAAKDIAQVRVVFSGAGAAALASAEHYVRLGVQRQHITLCDVHGPIESSRTDLNPYQARFARAFAERSLGELLRGADVFIGLSTGGIVTAEMVRGMAERPIVFALANPTPEIMPDEVRRARPDALIATGRSDFPNQVNNVLGFPFIFRGALDVRAKQINGEMEMAATRALASLAREEVPEDVMRAYGLDRLRFGPDYLIPKPFDPRVLLWVAPAVAWAAVGTGVARRVIDVEEYRAELDARLGKVREVMRGLTLRAQQDPQRIVFPEGEDTRIVRAARTLADDGAARPILLGDVDVMRRLADGDGRGSDGPGAVGTAPAARHHAARSPRPREGPALLRTAAVAPPPGRRGRRRRRHALRRRDPARARSHRRRAGAASHEQRVHARLPAADDILRRLHGEHRARLGDAGGNRVDDSAVRVAPGNRAARRDAVLLQFRLGKASRRRAGAARRAAAP